MWTVAGGPDPEFDDARRVAIAGLLTHPHLLTSFREYFSANADLDVAVRELEYVWDCPVDGTANVVGYLCAGCGCRRHFFAGEPSRVSAPATRRFRARRPARQAV